MIIFFLPNLRAGGAERVLLTLAVELHARGLDVGLLLGKKEGALDDFLPADIKLHELGASSAVSMIAPLISYARKYVPKVIIATLGASVTTALAKPFLPRETKVISRLGNTITAEYQTLSPAGKLKYRLAGVSGRWFSDHHIFQSKFMRADYERFSGGKITRASVIYNPVNPEIVSLAVKEPEEVFDFLAVGRLMTQKNYHYLLSIAARPEMEVYSFGIAGQGPMFDELQHRIELEGLQERVVLLGHLSNPYPIMRGSRFLLSTSLYEGFSNVIIESLALGTPVIATDCPSGNREVITEKNGRLIPLNDAAAAAGILKEALITKFDAAQISHDAKARFACDIIADQYVNLIESIV